MASSPGVTASDVTPRALIPAMGSALLYGFPVELPGAAPKPGLSHGTSFSQPGGVICCGLTNSKLLKERSLQGDCLLWPMCKRRARRTPLAAEMCLERSPDQTTHPGSVAQLLLQPVEEEEAVWCSHTSAD